QGNGSPTSEGLRDALKVHSRSSCLGGGRRFTPHPNPPPLKKGGGDRNGVPLKCDCPALDGGGFGVGVTQRDRPASLVMPEPGQRPRLGIHVFLLCSQKSWIPAPGAGMTQGNPLRPG